MMKLSRDFSKADYRGIRSFIEFQRCLTYIFEIGLSRLKKQFQIKDCNLKKMIPLYQNKIINNSVNKPRLAPLFVYTLSVLALSIFLYGFFPPKFSSTPKARKDNENETSKPRYIDKLAIIVIDALRYDFVISNDDQNYMPFVLSSLLKNESCYTVTTAHSPTVTLPRIKAITSGSVPTYFDVILNFMTPAFEEENIIHSAVSKGLKVVFYGDDTWLKLFPTSFLRSEGTTSFFAYDYVEVDDNVTKHINNELLKDDWDIIILHYLGLDHIGHTEGPNSLLVPPKLLEMDAIVKKFHDHFKKLEKNKGLKTMLIVTGDHGMKDSGSHGGVTHPEVLVPLVSVGNPCVVLQGWDEIEMPLQIDLAPTLSTLLGLPIPANNMGKIIPSLLHNMPEKDILKNLELNRVGLGRFLATSDDDSIKAELEAWLLTENKEFGINLTKKYYQTLRRFSQQLESSNSGFKLIYLIIGMTLLWISLMYLLYDFITRHPNPQNSIHWFFIIATILHGMSLFSSSFIEEEHQTWYFFWTTLCILAFMVGNRRKPSIAHRINITSGILWLVLATIHRLLRKLNQTGDKWAFMPDIRLYLYSEKGQTWLLCLFLLALGIVFICAAAEGCSQSQLTTYGIALIAVAGYRIATGNFKIKAFYPSSRGLIEIIIFWAATSLFVIQTAYSKTPIYLVWLLFNSLLLRPHNVILLPVEVFTSKELNILFQKSIWNSVAHVWLGNVFYFYQGNGNSLSNIDVAAGFVGINTYNPIYAGVMIGAHTFNSHILAYILSPKHDLVPIILRIIPVTLYCSVVIFHLNHLFIWSVFSPKLLFESSITIIFLLLMYINSLFNLFI